MIHVALFCGLVFLLPPIAAPVDGPKVAAVEILDVRRAHLKTPKPENRFSFDRPGLKLVIEVQGEDVLRASQYGMLELDAATDNTGAKLKFNEESFSFNDIRKEFVEVDRSQMFMGEENPPKDVIRVELALESPARAAASISLRGKLQLKKVATVDVVVPATPGEVKNEELTKAGVKFKVAEASDENSFVYEVSGKLEALFDATVVDAQGKPFEIRGRMSSGGGESSRREIFLEKPVPPDAKVRLAIVTKAEVVPVPFDLKDLKLP